MEKFHECSRIFSLSKNIDENRWCVIEGLRTLSSKKFSGRSNARAKSGKSSFPRFTAAWLQSNRVSSKHNNSGLCRHTSIRGQIHGSLVVLMARRSRRPLRHRFLVLNHSKGSRIRNQTQSPLGDHPHFLGYYCHWAEANIPWNSNSSCSKAGEIKYNKPLENTLAKCLTSIFVSRGREKNTLDADSAPWMISSGMSWFLTEMREQLFTSQT